MVVVVGLRGGGGPMMSVVIILGFRQVESGGDEER